jgi:hypothetical protein
MTQKFFWSDLVVGYEKRMIPKLREVFFTVLVEVEKICISTKIISQTVFGV